MRKLLSVVLFSICFTIVSFAQDKIAKGTKVTILEIASADSYYSERADFLGNNATALGELSKKSNGFYSGTLETENGRTCFFTAVKVAVTGAPKKSVSADAGLFSGTSIPKGTRFTVIEVPSDDAYYSDRDEIEGESGTTDAVLELEDGYVGGSLKLDNGKSYYFYKVKIGKYNASASPKKAAVKTTTTAKTPKFITGTIKKGTEVYLAEISPEDSYYSDRFDKIGNKGKVTKQDMTMKSDGWYAGDFAYDDGSTAYFYKAKFSKEPVDRIERTDEDAKKFDIFDKYEWDDAENDDDISEGDIVEVTAVSEEDSYYDDRDDYIGQQGVAGDDLEYDADNGGYGGTITLDNGEEPYFYLVKLKKIKAGSSESGSSSSASIAKGTRVKVTDVDADDSFYSARKTYIGKSGKVAEGLSTQGNGCYSGKIVFDDGTDAYFYKVKVTVIK